MEYEIVYENGLWCARNHELSPLQCRKNLYPRLKYLCGGDFLNSMKRPEILDNNHDEVLCLCGMKLNNSFVVKHPCGIMCRLGANCAMRLDKDIVSRYLEKIKIPGTCWLCDTMHKHIPTHYRSKAHKKRLIAYKLAFVGKLEYHVYNKYLKYIRQVLIEKEQKAIESENTTKIIEKFLKRKYLEVEHVKNGDRKCASVICRNYILWEEPSWKIRCLSCYKKYKNNYIIQEKVADYFD